jgi:hypothetical protein
MTRAELKEHCEKTCAVYEQHYINSYLGNKRYEEHKLVLELLKEIEKLEENKKDE